MPESTTKRCARCGLLKSFADFPRSSKEKDGYRHACKGCINAHTRERAASRRSDPRLKEKHCTACNTVKPVSAFTRDSRRVDGLFRMCRDCHKAHRAEYPDRYRAARQKHYYTHLEAMRQRGREWQRDHPGQRRAIDARRLPRNSPEDKARKQTWRRANASRVNETNRRRWARKLNLTVTRVDYDEIWERDRGMCYICGQPVIRSDCHFDHIIPLARDGSHSYDNIAVTHATCNLRKGTKLVQFHQQELF